jgi:hypothetical protein
MFASVPHTRWIRQGHLIVGPVVTRDRAPSRIDRGGDGGLVAHDELARLALVASKSLALTGQDELARLGLLCHGAAGDGHAATERRVGVWM